MESLNGPELPKIEEVLKGCITSKCLDEVVFQKSLSVQGLIGITVDESVVFLININEILEDSAIENIKENVLSKDNSFADKTDQKDQGKSTSQLKFPAPSNKSKRKRRNKTIKNSHISNLNKTVSIKNCIGNVNKSYNLRNNGREQKSNCFGDRNAENESKIDSDIKMVDENDKEPLTFHIKQSEDDKLNIVTDEENYQLLPNMECKVKNESINDDHKNGKSVKLTLSEIKEKKFWGKKSQLKQIQKLHIKEINIQDGKLQYQCDVCSRMFSTVSNARRHLIVHGLHQRRFPCKKCNLNFDTRKKLADHNAIKHDEKVIICEVCQKKFKNKVIYSRHSCMKGQNVSNTEETRFMCEECGKLYVRNEGLKYHISTVHAKNTVQCGYCKKHFPYRSNLKRHINNCGSRLVTPDAKVECFPCNKCGNVFFQKAQLNDHVKHMHTDQKYICNKCGKVIQWRHSFNVHLSKCCGQMNGKGDIKSCEISFESKISGDMNKTESNKIENHVSDNEADGETVTTDEKISPFQDLKQYSVGEEPILKNENMTRKGMIEINIPPIKEPGWCSISDAINRCVRLPSKNIEKEVVGRCATNPVSVQSPLNVFQSHHQSNELSVFEQLLPAVLNHPIASLSQTQHCQSLENHHQHEPNVPQQNREQNLNSVLDISSQVLLSQQTPMIPLAEHVSLSLPHSIHLMPHLYTPVQDLSHHQAVPNSESSKSLLQENAKGIGGSTEQLDYTQDTCTYEYSNLSFSKS